MLLLNIKVHDCASCIHSNNFKSGCIGNSQDGTHFINELCSAIVGKKVSDSLIQLNRGLDTIHEGHSDFAVSRQNVLNVLPIVHVFVAATL